MASLPNPLAVQMSSQEHRRLFWKRGGRLCVVALLIVNVPFLLLLADILLGSRELDAFLFFAFLAFLIVFIPDALLVAWFLWIKRIAKESGVRRLLIEQISARQIKLSLESFATVDLPANRVISPMLVQKELLILEELGLVRISRVGRQYFVSLTTLGWARAERKEKTVELPSGFTMNDMSNTFNNSPIGNASFVVNSENVSVQQTQHGTQVDLNRLAEQLGTLRQTLLRDSDLTAEKTVDVGKVAQAEQLAKNGDGNGALAVLKSVGKWALDAAEKISLDLVLKVLGLPV